MTKTRNYINCATPRSRTQSLESSAKSIQFFNKKPNATILIRSQNKTNSSFIELPCKKSLQHIGTICIDDPMLSSVPSLRALPPMQESAEQILNTADKGYLETQLHLRSQQILVI